MLELQDGMNNKVNPDWVAANNNWYRAIQVEGVEAIEHHGWKWWKKQDCKLAQLQMELVDIWHFILSMLHEPEAKVHRYTAPDSLIDFLKRL